MSISSFLKDFLWKRMDLLYFNLIKKTMIFLQFQQLFLIGFIFISTFIYICLISTFATIIFSFRIFCIEYFTAIVYEQVIKGRLYKYFKAKKIKLVDLKPKHIQDFFDLPFSEGLSRNTVKHYRAN